MNVCLNTFWAHFFKSTYLNIQWIKTMLVQLWSWLSFMFIIMRSNKRKVEQLYYIMPIWKERNYWSSDNIKDRDLFYFIFRYLSFSFLSLNKSQLYVYNTSTSTRHDKIILYWLHFYSFEQCRSLQSSLDKLENVQTSF